MRRKEIFLRKRIIQLRLWAKWRFVKFLKPLENNMTKSGNANEVKCSKANFNRSIWRGQTLWQYENCWFCYYIYERCWFCSCCVSYHAVLIFSEYLERFYPKVFFRSCNETSKAPFWDEAGLGLNSALASRWVVSS